MKDVARIVKSYPKCTSKCVFYKHMVDINDPSYMVSFCSYYREGIDKGTHCLYYMEKVKDDEENA